MYDRMKYHQDTVLAYGLPIERAANHAIQFLRWMAENELLSELLKQECNEQLEQFSNGENTLFEVFEWFDYSLSEDMFSQKGKEFASVYYGEHERQYIHDYQLLCQNQLPTMYHVILNDEIYNRVKSRIDDRYQEWSLRRKIAYNETSLSPNIVNYLKKFNSVQARRLLETLHLFATKKSFTFPNIDKGVILYKLDGAENHKEIVTLFSPKIYSDRFEMKVQVGIYLHDVEKIMRIGQIPRREFDITIGGMLRKISGQNISNHISVNANMSDDEITHMINDFLSTIEDSITNLYSYNHINAVTIQVSNL